MESGLFFYLVLFIGIFYFLLYRPQQKHKKQRQELMDSLKVGDDVVTIGGIHGEVVKFGGETITLMIAENVEIVVQKTAIGFVLGDNNPENEEDEDYDEEVDGEESEQAEVEELEAVDMGASEEVDAKESYEDK